jgi:hypothetical protein
MSTSSWKTILSFSPFLFCLGCSEKRLIWLVGKVHFPQPTSNQHNTQHAMQSKPNSNSNNNNNNSNNNANQPNSSKLLGSLLKSENLPEDIAQHVNSNVSNVRGGGGGSGSGSNVISDADMLAGGVDLDAEAAAAKGVIGF